MRFAFICDIHLPKIESAATYAYLDRALESVAINKPDFCVVAGDITAAGEGEAFDAYLKRIEKIKDIRTITLLGNAEVRNPEKDFSAYAQETVVEGEGRVFCINTPYGRIENPSALEALADGDILIMHHGVDGLEERSRAALTAIMEKRRITLLHGHKHSFLEYTLGKSRVVGLRALDPDKSIGAPPCITYFEVEKGEVSFKEERFGIPKAEVTDFRGFLGISCFDVQKCFDVAEKYDVKHIELRKYDEADGLFGYTLERVATWRERGGRSLSIHLPNVALVEGEIVATGWEYALTLAKSAGVNAYTIHPPKVSVREVKAHFERFVEFYYRQICALPTSATVGIENVHRSKKDPAGDEGKYGCTPEEVCALIDGINARFGYERVGAVLDVGHARNNPPFNASYTNGVWYALMGKRTVGYHIHQVAKDEEGKLRNHRGIKDWFGPLISYSAFFYEWAKGNINRRPAYLEVKRIEEVCESIEAFDKLQEL